jgi:ribosomal protein S18 acetylase RimI-like enzyme
MKKTNIDIKLSKKNTNKIKDFEKTEWHLADLKHYGRDDIDFTQKKYKFVARNSSGEVVGILNLMTEANLAFIESLLVSSKQRRMGIGKRLVTEAEKFAKENNCTKIWLETNKSWNAVRFYKKINYKITAKHDKHILNQTTLILTKYL